MSCRWMGSSASLVVPVVRDGLLVIDEIYTIDPLWYVPGSGISATKIRFNSTYTQEVEVSRSKLIVAVHDSQFSNPYGTSLIQNIKDDVRDKINADTAHQLYLQKFGIPGIILHVPEGTDKTKMNEWSASLTDMREGYVAVVDDVKIDDKISKETYRLEIVDMSKGGNTDYLSYKNSKDKDILIGLGIPPMLFNADEAGSYSLGAIQKEIFNMIVQDCQDMIQQIFCNQIVQPLIKANFGTDVHGQLVFQEVEGRALKELSQAIAVLFANGILINTNPNHIMIAKKILGIPLSLDENGQEEIGVELGKVIAPNSGEKYSPQARLGKIIPKSGEQGIPQQVNYSNEEPTMNEEA